MYVCISIIILMSETNLKLDYQKKKKKLIGALIFSNTQTQIYRFVPHRTSYYVVPMFMIEIITKTFRPEPHNNHTQ